MSTRGVRHRRTVGWLACLTALVAAGTSGVLPAQQQSPPPAPPAAAQQQPERAQQAPIRSGINFVRVDVIVSDGKGNPVLDLQASDFTVTEDNKPQKVEQFSVVKIDNVAQAEDRPPSAIRSDFDEEREAARPDVRLFVILLDDYHVRRGNSMSVRKPLIDFIQNQLGPADMLALMYPLTPVADIRFSRNRDAAIGAIERFDGRKFDYTPRNPFEEQYAYYPAATVERIRNQITMGALEGRCHSIGRAARGTQVDHLCQRGLHRDAAAADERSGGRDARPRQRRASASGHGGGGR